MLLLPDGVGVRNFVYSKFISFFYDNQYSAIAYSDQNILELIKSNQVEKIKLPITKPLSIWGELFKIAWTWSLLKYQAKKTTNKVFLWYIISNTSNSWKHSVKYSIAQIITQLIGRFEKGIIFIRFLYIKNASCAKYYKQIYDQLVLTKPDLVFCTHQRASKAIGALLAARKLGIPTACFIYSWDNLPKATLFVEADYYFVWSAYMKAEMHRYHPSIQPERVVVTGTPQFECYFNEQYFQSKQEFAQIYGLPSDQKWICFSGDDITTSPFDPLYLEDLAQAVSQWNNTRGREKLHIVFRRCPVDMSDRYNIVLRKYADIITSVDPAWGTLDSTAGWNAMVPMLEDTELLVNTARHCSVVVNIGSTMAHDFAIVDNPCIYIKYNVPENQIWDIHKIYQFIHFESMDGLNPVIWVQDKADWINALDTALYTSEPIVKDCKQWTARIAEHPLDGATSRIFQAIQTLA